MQVVLPESDYIYEMISHLSSDAKHEIIGLQLMLCPCFQGPRENEGLFWTLYDRGVT